MFNVFAAEVRRCLTRRISWIFALVALAIYVLSFALTMVSSAYTGSRFIMEEDLHFHVITWFTLSLFAFLVWASSMIGAEWSSGNMANLLVWHPRRAQLWVSKWLAISAVALIAMIIFLAIIVGTKFIYVLALAEMGNLTGEWFAGYLLYFLRLITLGLLLVAAGAAMAMWGRHTSIAPSTVGAIFILNPILVWVVLGIAFGVEYPELFSLVAHAEAWIDGSKDVSSTAGREPKTIGMFTGLGVLTAFVGVIFAGATQSFIRRDV